MRNIPEKIPKGAQKEVGKGQKYSSAHTFECRMFHLSISQPPPKKRKVKVIKEIGTKRSSWLAWNLWDMEIHSNHGGIETV